MSDKNIGKVVQVIGPVLDIRFDDGHLPELLTAIEIMNGDKKIVAEVAQHVGDNVVRCISMNATDGMVRGMDAVDTGSPITVPVGNECLGRIFNLLGQAIDNKALVAWEDMNYTSLHLVQVVTPEGSTVNEEVEIANYTISSEEQAAKQVIFSNLEPSCNYIVRAYMNGEYQGKKVFSTAAPEEFEGAVKNLRGIPEEEAYGMLTASFYEDLVAEFPDQDVTVVLEGGQKYEMMSLKRG